MSGETLNLVLAIILGVAMVSVSILAIVASIAIWRQK